MYVCLSADVSAWLSVHRTPLCLCLRARYLPLQQGRVRVRNARQILVPPLLENAVDFLSARRGQLLQRGFPFAVASPEAVAVPKNKQRVPTARTSTRTSVCAWARVGQNTPHDELTGVAMPLLLLHLRVAYSVINVNSCRQACVRSIILYHHPHSPAQHYYHNPAECAERHPAGLLSLGEARVLLSPALGAVQIDGAVAADPELLVLGQVEPVQAADRDVVLAHAFDVETDLHGQATVAARLRTHRETVGG
jgi:hypothetical protein